MVKKIKCEVGTCPKCKTDDVDFKNQYHIVNELQQHFKCNQCGCIFVEINDIEYSHTEYGG